MRPVPAFLLSPLAAVALGKLIGFQISFGSPADAVLGILILYLLCVLLQLVVAAPLRLIFAKRGWQSAWLDCGLGSIALALPAAIWVATGGNASVPVPALGIALAAVFGATIGMTYGLLRWRDRKAARMPTPRDLAARFD